MMMRGQKPRERGSGFVAHTKKKHADRAEEEREEQL
jgi:hypothetical protein